MVDNSPNLRHEALPRLIGCCVGSYTLLIDSIRAVLHIEHYTNLYGIFLAILTRHIEISDVHFTVNVRSINEVP